MIQLRECFQFQGLNQAETQEFPYLELMPYGKARSLHSSKSMELESIYHCESKPQLDVLRIPLWGLGGAKVYPQAINFFNLLYLLLPLSPSYIGNTNYLEKYVFW